MSTSAEPVPVMCRYRIKPGQAEAFREILVRHWSALHQLGLTTDEPAQLWSGGDMAGNVAFFESFAWKTGESSQTAHETPGVMQLWEPMGALCDDMEFWNVQPLSS